MNTPDRNYKTSAVKKNSRQLNRRQQRFVARCKESAIKNLIYLNILVSIRKEDDDAHLWRFEEYVNKSDEKCGDEEFICDREWWYIIDLFYFYAWCVFSLYSSSFCFSILLLFCFSFYLSYFTFMSFDSSPDYTDAIPTLYLSYVWLHRVYYLKYK